MRKVLATLVALSLLVSVFTGVFASVPGAKAAGPAAVNLGTAGNFVIQAKSGISTTGTTHVTGDIGVSPAAASAITGFGLTMDKSNTFSTSSLVTGKIYAADYHPPTPHNMTTAVSDMETAYTAAAGVTASAPVVGLGAGNIGGMILAPGVYKWSTGVTIPTNVTLAGGASDVWIFQIAQTVDISSAQKVILSGGAQAANIFWQVAGQTTLGTTSVFNGTILDLKAIVLNTGATWSGRLLAQTAVTLDAATNTVSAPAPAPVPVPVPAPTNMVYHHTFFIGYPDGTFKPDRNVSRAEVAEALTRALGLGWSNTAPSYPDVPATHWAAGDIQIMKDESIMTGDTSGTFRPDAFITRAEAAALLRMLKVAPIQNLVASSFK